VLLVKDKIEYISGTNFILPKQLIEMVRSEF